MTLLSWPSPTMPLEWSSRLRTRSASERVLPAYGFERSPPKSAPFPTCYPLGRSGVTRLALGWLQNCGGCWSGESPLCNRMWKEVALASTRLFIADESPALRQRQRHRHNAGGRPPKESRGLGQKSTAGAEDSVVDDSPARVRAGQQTSSGRPEPARSGLFPRGDHDWRVGRGL
jgi:hypothetical protein